MRPDILIRLLRKLEALDVALHGGTETSTSQSLIILKNTTAHICSLSPLGASTRQMASKHLAVTRQGCDFLSDVVASGTVDSRSQRTMVTALPIPGAGRSIPTERIRLEISCIHSVAARCRERISQTAHTSSSAYTAEELTRAVRKPIATATAKITTVKVSAQSQKPSAKAALTRRAEVFTTMAIVTQAN